MEPPVPIPNTEVKHRCADGSVAIGHVRVGRRQFILPPFRKLEGGSFFMPACREQGRIALLPGDSRGSLVTYACGKDFLGKMLVFGDVCRPD